jgi:glycosyltransferase involved in cell wall biosynthesis
LKILLTNTSLHAERATGVAQRTAFFALELSALGHQCTVVSIEGGAFADRLAAAGIAVHVTGSMGPGYRFAFINPWKLRRLIRAADVVHVLGIWNPLSVLACLLASAGRRPYAFCPLGELEGFAADARLDKRVFRALFANRMIRNAASLIAQGPNEREQIQASLGVAPDRIAMIENGISVPRPLPAAADPRLPASPFILFVGRLARIKGPDLLLEAFGRVCNDFPDTKLVLAGSDFGMQGQLERRVREYGLGDRVVFTGFLGEAAKALAYSRAALVVIPSRSDVLPFVVSEAGAAGKPLLVTDRSGFNLLESIGGGRVVPATVEGLAAGLAELLPDRGELLRMGTRLQVHVLEHYTWPAQARRLADHFATLSP